MSFENSEIQKLKIIRPTLKWIFKFVPTFLLSYLAFGLIIIIEKINPNFELNKVGLDFLGIWAFKTYDHAIKWSPIALYFAAFGIVLLLIFQAFAVRNGSSWDKYQLAKHVIFEHLAEILIWACGAFVGLLAQKYQLATLNIAQSIGYGIAIFFVIACSYFYFFIMENENFLQLKVNLILDEILKITSELVNFISNFFVKINNIIIQTKNKIKH